MPFLLERLDTLWRKRNYRDEWDQNITDAPSTYVPGHIWGCFFEDDFGVSVRDAIGVDMIMYETDYPHQDSTWPDSLAYATKALADVGVQDVEKIVRGNAIKLFGLPDALPA
jgi:predicted TIM-barrel fold metal-dependent hydrolase